MNLDRRLHAFRPDLADARLKGRVEAARFAQGERMAVLAASAPMHREPHYGAGLDTELVCGQTVRVFEQHEGWAWAQSEADSYVGYVPADRLGPPGPPATHRVAVNRTFAYPGPSMKLPHVAALSLGARLSVAGLRQVERQGEFAVGAGVTGLAEVFVFAAHLAPLDKPAADPVLAAEALAGAPYLWGGRTSIGLDCSALSQIAYDSAGVALPRDSDMQEAGAGERLPDDAPLRRGDLVFWKGHVAIMTSPTRMIHASGHQMLVVEEELAQAAARIAGKGGGPVTCRRRVLPAG